MINGIFCLLLGSVLLFAPDAFRFAIESLIEALRQDKPALSSVLFVAALVEATFPLTVAFPGSFIIILAVIAGSQQDGDFFLLLSSGSLGIILGNLLTFAWALLSREKNEGYEEPATLSGNINIFIAMIANAVPSLGALYIFINARKYGKRSAKYLSIQLISTPFIIAGAIIVLQAYGYGLVQLSLTYSRLAGMLLVVIALVEFVLHLKNRRRSLDLPIIR